MTTLSNGGGKPNRIDLKEYGGKKSKDYHLAYAKYRVDAAQTTSFHDWKARIKVNKKFYANKQWEHPEDVNTFLMDSTGNARNRMRVVFNQILPMIEQFRGNASRMKINASAKNFSPLSITRKEVALAGKIARTRIANEFPFLGDIMRQKDPSIGQEEKDTIDTFNNLYVDAYVTQINALLRFYEKNNKLPKMQMPMAQSLALSGLIATENFEHGGHLRTRLIQPDEVIFDPDARETDLSDGSYCGYHNPMDVSMILERYQPDNLDATALENHASSQQAISEQYSNFESTSFKSTRVPVYKVFWKDTEKEEWGYIMNEHDLPELVRVNYTKEGEDKPSYTDKDMIDPPESSKNRKRFKGRKKTNLFYDCVRYCVFVPGEYIAKANEDKEGDRKNFDIVLDHGLEEYQEVEYHDLSNVKFPIKFQTWGYVDGEVFSPVDAAINPQRLVNRLMSVAEQQINNSGGSGMVIDDDAIKPGDEDSIHADSKEGKTITVRTRGKGVPNTVTTYDNTPKQGTYNLFGIIPTIKNMTQDVTGVNEALQGQSMGPDQLVGVTELLIQKGSLMQEPFYDAIASVQIQNYQYAATCGKRMYIENERELEIAVGDDGLEILKLSKDMKNEDFRVEISRENDSAILKSQANSLLMLFKEMQIINEDSFADLYDRSTPDDVTRRVRAEAGLRREAVKRQAKEMQQQAFQDQATQEFEAERSRQDTLNMAQQPERISNAQIQGKMDQEIMKQVLTDQEQGV